MSRSAFAVRVKVLVGATPADYLTHWCLAVAQAALRSGASVKAISADLGCANARRPSRLFIRRVGVSPREWLDGLE